MILQLPVSTTNQDEFNRRVAAAVNALIAQPASLGNYANDAAAATAGVPIGGLYRTASALMVRVA